MFLDNDWVLTINHGSEAIFYQLLVEFVQQKDVQQAWKSTWLVEQARLKLVQLFGRLSSTGLELTRLIEL